MLFDTTLLLSYFELHIETAPQTSQYLVTQRVFSSDFLFPLWSLSGTPAKYMYLTILMSWACSNILYIVLIYIHFTSFEFRVNFPLKILCLPCLFIFHLDPYSLHFSILFSVSSNSQALVTNGLFQSIV